MAVLMWAAAILISLPFSAKSYTAQELGVLVSE
jgi:hypothetical protein